MTDANVVLGFIPVGEVADGQITIRRELAEAAVERVATPLGLTVLEAADGIHRIANARMTRALRSVSSEKGRDPRDFAIIAYGGSGPVHAGGLADELGVTTILVPAGGRAVQRRRPAVRAARVPRGPLLPSRRRRGRPGDDRIAPRGDGGGADARVRRPCRPTSGRARPTSATAGRAGRSRSSCPTGPLDRQLLAALRARFEDEHELLYGVRGRPGSPVEVRAVRLAALGPSAASPSFDVADPLVRERQPTRRMWLGGVAEEVPVRSRVSVGVEPEPGPLLVDEYDTTVVVPGGWSVRRHLETGTLVLEQETSRA